MSALGQAHTHQATVPHGQSAQPPYHHDALELFLGESTRLSGHGGTMLALGVDYEHRFDFWDHHLGLGMMIDYEGWQENRGGEWMVTPTVDLYPLSHLKLFAGGGFCLEQTAMMPLLRLGGAYEIDLGHHLLLMPLVEWDRTAVFDAITSGICVGFAR